MMIDHLCECGCGRPTRIAPVSDASKGWVRGVPLKFIKGHNLTVGNRSQTLARIGQKCLNGEGYVRVLIEKGNRKYEHRIIAERALGRKLKRYGNGNKNNEVIHHVNGDKTDNRPCNLLICTAGYHTSLHVKLEKSENWPQFKVNPRNGGK